MRGLLTLIGVVIAAGGAAATDVVRPPAAPAKAPPVPAAVAAALAGYGELAIGLTRLRAEDSGFTAGHLLTYSAGAYFNVPHGDRWNLEIEGRGYRVDWAGSYTASDGGVFAHGYWRDPSRYALGAFGGYTALSLYGMQGNMLTVGGEALAYMNALTLYGQAAWYRSTTSAGWLYFTGYLLRGTARYFATPNLRLQLDAQRATLDNSDHTVAWTVVGTAEYRHSASYLAAFARVRWDGLTPVLNQPYSTINVMFGLRGYFGSGTLLDNDRRGAPMDVLPFPPLYALNFG